MDSITRLRSIIRAAAPAIALFLTIVLMLAPVRLFQGYVPMPLLPLIVVFLYAAYEPEALPPPVAFGLGLLHDLLYGAGLGIWAASYLLIQYLVFSQHDYLRGRVRHVIWLAFGVTLIAVGILIWTARSLLAGGWLPALPLVYQMFITFAVYPLASMLFFYLRNRTAAEEALR
jgi:rod shape-determining protein MreD